MIVKAIRTFFFLLLLSIPFLTSAQSPRRYTSSEILLKLQKLNVLGNALYVAAHPDDENTRMITYLANDRLVNAAYLSMTRGDGGQNLIGPEIREQLGIIRTQELLAARRIDNGRQFFTRANDFGYSKNTEETQKIWDRQQVLSDIVWTFRLFRPDVVLTRFPPDGRGGHGHHTTSSILAEEAFKISGDPDFFPEQLQFVEVWSPKRLMTNTGRWWNTEISEEDEGVISVDVGGFSPLLGRSFTEIAAISRSQHKSQGFGATGSRGEEKEYLEYRLGSQTNDDLFEGIDITWNRVKGGMKMSGKILEIIQKFDHNEPGAIVDELISLREDISRLDDSFWKRQKTKEIDELIKASTGLFVEVKAKQFYAVPGESVDISIEVVNRSSQQIKLKKVSIEKTGFIREPDIDLQNNMVQIMEGRIDISDQEPYSNPYWLNEKGSIGMYHVDNQQLIGKPENAPALEATLIFQISGSEIRYSVPVVYKWNDRVKGEQYRPFIIQPPVILTMKSNVVVFASGNPKQVTVEVTANKKDLQGIVSLKLPKGWSSEPEKFEMEFTNKEEIQSVSFSVTPPSDEQDVEITAQFQSNGKIFDKNAVMISHDHFPIQTLFPQASAKFVRLNITRKGDMIGYVMGAGDDVPKSLEQIGYKVRILKEEDLTSENLATLDAVIMGVRVVNTNTELKKYNPALLSYVEGGGTLIYQFNTSRGISWQDFAPYEISFSGGSSDSRVSVEEAPVSILLPDHPVVKGPNPITAKDFDGWVQERGLYFPNKWSENYDAVLSSNDPGEEAKDGGLLIAKYGKGYYVYTGYAWFRQLPAGVPGAYHLFTNIISLGNGESQKDLDLDLKD